MVTSGNLDVMGTWNDLELDELELHTADLVLRPWRAEDAPDVERIMADPRMSDFLPLPRPYTRADADAFVAGFARVGRRDGTRLECAVVSDGRLVGAAGLRLPVQNTEPEIGYWIAGAAWGNGFATQATRALSDFGFSQGINRIRLLADVGNAASAAVALKSGFRFEGVLRQASRSQTGLADHALFARLAADSGEPVAPALPRLDSVSDGTILLRPVQADDWPVILAENTNAESQRWGFGTVMTETQARERAGTAGLTWLTGRGAELVIVDADTGRAAGLISLRQSGPPNIGGIGYGILPEFRGRRFTTRALRLLADWAFDRTALVRLELGCKVDNIASARSAELAGFVRDARYAGRLINPDGTYSDEIGFGLVKPS